jgi:hypothetical protein
MKEDLLDIIAENVTEAVRDEEVTVEQIYDTTVIQIILKQRYHRVWFRSVRETIIQATKTMLSLYLPEILCNVWFDKYWEEPDDGSDRSATLYIEFPKMFKSIYDTIWFMRNLHMMFARTSEEIITYFKWLNHNDFLAVYDEFKHPESIAPDRLLNVYTLPFFPKEDVCNAISEFKREDVGKYMLRAALNTTFITSIDRLNSKYVNIEHGLDHFIGEDLTSSVPLSEIKIYFISRNNAGRAYSLIYDIQHYKLRFIHAAAYKSEDNMYRYGIQLTEPFFMDRLGLCILYASFLKEIPEAHTKTPMYNLGAELMSYMQSFWKRQKIYEK